MSLNRFLIMFAAIVGGSIVFGILRDTLGFDDYAISTMGVIAGGMFVLMIKKDISELSFWLIITYAGKNFDGGSYLLFFALIFAYILASAGFITVRRK